MTGPQAQMSSEAGTNINICDITSEKPSFLQSGINEKQRQLAEDTAAADRKGGGTYISALIDDEIETLHSGFKRGRRANGVMEKITMTSLKAKKTGKDYEKKN